MSYLQPLLAYTALLLAVGFLVKKFLFPRKKPTKGCGKKDCGCH